MYEHGGSVIKHFYDVLQLGTHASFVSSHTQVQKVEKERAEASQAVRPPTTNPTTTTTAIASLIRSNENNTDAGMTTSHATTTISTYSQQDYY